MTDRELMQMVLDALSNFDKGNHGMRWQVPLIKALRARLSQPEQEPAAWPDAPMKIYLQVCDDDVCEVPFSEHDEVSWCQGKINGSDVAYIRADITPPQREWVGLTDEEIRKGNRESWVTMQAWESSVWWAEAKLKEKNDG